MVIFAEKQSLAQYKFSEWNIYLVSYEDTLESNETLVPQKNKTMSIPGLVYLEIHF